MIGNEWIEIIQYLEPIDVLASLLTINRNVYHLIRNLCIVKLDDICRYCNGEKLVLNISIYKSNDQNTTWNVLNGIIDDDQIELIGNVKYFIRLYLLKFALKLGNIDPERLSMRNEDISNILSVQVLELLDFYRLMFFPEFKKVHQNQTIDYMILGESGVGKSTLGNFIQFGYLRNSIGIQPYYFIKRISNPNEEFHTKHQIWETFGEERFFSKSEIIQDRWDKNSGLVNVFAFSMDHEFTFNELDEWFKASGKNSDIGIVLGLHPTSSRRYKIKHVAMKDAVRKAYKYLKSVFVEVDCKNAKNSFVLVWFIQLQLTFFNSLFKKSTEEQSGSWNCSLL